MADLCTVLIAAADLLPALKERAAVEAGELLTFTDADALRALEAITIRRPSTVALERAFAATPRGAAMINRIKDNPLLTQSAIEVVWCDADHPRVSSGQGLPEFTTAVVETAVAVEADGALDAEGTRRAPRFAMAHGVAVLVDGNPTALVDLSVVGAQVVSPTILKPNQRVRVTLSDERGTCRVSGTISWAAFEMPPRYRAGIEFIDADAAAVDAYCQRHRA